MFVFRLFISPLTVVPCAQKRLCACSFDHYGPYHSACMTHDLSLLRVFQKKKKTTTPAAADVNPTIAKCLVGFTCVFFSCCVCLPPLCWFRIPSDVEYTHEKLPSMSSEELEKLNAVRPETFAAASQIQGMTPHSLVYLYNHVTRRSKVRLVLQAYSTSIYLVVFSYDLAPLSTPFLVDSPLYSAAAHYIILYNSGIFLNHFLEIVPVFFLESILGVFPRQFFRDFPRWPGLRVRFSTVAGLGSDSMCISTTFVECLYIYPSCIVPT